VDKKASQNSSRDNLLDAAEQLFAARGYTAVTLKHIADKLGIKQASLYYHFPLGKEDLYVEVMLRHLEHRLTAFARAIESAEPTLCERAEPTLADCLYAVGIWLIQQPPLNSERMMMSDLPELSPDKADLLGAAMGRCAFDPIVALFVRYRHQLKERFQSDLGLLAGTFIATLESLYTYRRYGSKTDEELVLDTIALILGGALIP
jgi:AcrR family transcriptional regulator